MTRLEIVSTRRHNMFSTLDLFLRHHGISKEVSRKVRRNAQVAWNLQENESAESSVELLNLISDPLLMELHFEIYFPLICVQPFFRCYNEVNPVGMRKTCHIACSTFSLTKDDVLFAELETASTPRIYFVLHGTLEYERSATVEKQTVTPRDWISEPSLWVTDWMHWGTMRSKAEHTKVLAMDA